MHFGPMAIDQISVMKTMIKTYSELMQYSDFYDRYCYARIHGRVGAETFGWHRYLNQALYRTKKWRRVRDQVIVRDEGCDLAHPDYEISGKIIIHHLNPITIEDLESESELVYDPEFLICVSDFTHNAIHYGDETRLPQIPVQRYKGDTCLWR